MVFFGKKHVFFLVLLLAATSFKAYSAYNPTLSTLQTQIGGTVGDKYLNISGFASPYAAITLSSKEGILRTTTANKNGFFYISNILIKKVSNRLCFLTTDFNQVGDSQGCLNITIDKDVTDINNLLLPPTLGLKNKTILENSEVVVYGYSMPGAKVTLNTNQTAYSNILADKTGFYRFSNKNFQPGRYWITSKAKYSNLESLDPASYKLLIVNSKAQEIERKLTELVAQIPKALFSEIGLLCISFLLFIIIFLLLFKIKRSKEKET